MSLTNDDLKSIKQIIGGAIEKSETKMSDKIEFAIEKSELRMTSKIEKSKKEIVDVLGREISDLADVNRAVITRTDELDYRLRIVERKLGISK